MSKESKSSCTILLITLSEFNVWIRSFLIIFTLFEGQENKIRYSSYLREHTYQKLFHWM